MSPTTRKRQQPRSGFTLTEMLVATGLVVLIMLMFAQIYAVAIGTLREQRGLAQNDQRARIVSNMLRSDLQNMTFRQPAFPYGDVQGIVALAPGDEPIIDPVNQRGYFYYSENGVNNDTDDLIQFTVQIRSGQRGDAQTKSSQRPFIGKAGNLGVDNEPEQDDGQDSDQQGSSSAAEVSYFLRRGILYRRVLLLRDPLSQAIRADSQPSNPTTGNRRFNPGGSTTYTNFHDNFDYAATRRNGVLWFHSVESLDNNQGLRNYPIAIPGLRFGFRPSLTAVDSREFADSTLNPTGGNAFIGRFTVRETSSSAFEWPGTTGHNPYLAASTLELDLDSSEEGVVDAYRSGTRRGEDILLTNVEAFDVKIIDDSLGVFTDNSSGFDSWHPDAASGGNPPYQQYSETGLSNWSTTATNAIGIPVLGNNSMKYVQSNSGTNGTIRPELPPVPGTVIQDGSSQWKCVDNRIGIKAIQITIRFRDPTSNIPRQLTLVHSFVE